MMSTTVDHYAVLGVQRGASSDEIRTAYRQAARASHPDLHPEDATALERFKQVQLAYEVLGDPRLNHRPPVVGGVCADECGAVLRQFFAARRA